MLPKKHHLSLAKFDKNPQPAKRFFTTLFALKIKKSNISSSRAVVLVPKKLDKRSVFRHQTKRLIEQALNQYLAVVKEPIDIQIRALSILDKKDKEIINREISRVFKKLDI